MASELGKTDPDLLSRLWGSCVDTIYSLSSREKQLGLGEQVGVFEIDNLLTVDKTAHYISLPLRHTHTHSHVLHFIGMIFSLLHT